MKVIFIKNEKEFERLSTGFDVPLTQEFFYGKWQESVGKKVLRAALVNDEGEALVLFQAIVMSSPVGAYVYVPYGPVFKSYEDLTKEDLEEVKKCLIDISKEYKPFMIRLDPMPLTTRPVIKSFEDVFLKAPTVSQDGSSWQPRCEWYVPLVDSPEELLAGMHKKTRYNISLAKKKDVSIVFINHHVSEYKDVINKVLYDTANRKNFLLHTEDYYKAIIEDIDVARRGFIGIAYWNKIPLVVCICIRTGDTVMTLFSGSTTEHRETKATYLLRWEIMRYAKESGAKWLNMGGVRGENDSVHSTWSGFSDFKHGFGGEYFYHSDLYDIVKNPIIYVLFIVYKWIRSQKEKLKKVD